jgi:hypothetical protein
MGASSPFPRDITEAINQLFSCRTPHLVNATLEAERILRMFPACKLTVKQLAEIIIRESAKHAGSGVMVSRDG